MCVLCINVSYLGRPSKNVALGKPTYMSSVYYDNPVDYPSSGLIDGILGHVAATSNDGNPWMVIDLLDQYYVSTVKLTNTYTQAFGNVVELLCH